MKYSITPKDLLDSEGVKYKVHGNFYSVLICPSCQGGSSKAKYTFGVHAEDGNYFCLRATCGFKGSFWSLLEFYGKNPKSFMVKGSDPIPPKLKKKGFVYGKKI